MSIDLSIADHIATVIINRPDRLNAMDAAHYAELSRVWAEVRDNPAIRVAIVTGAGDRAFTVGADLKSFVTRAASWSETWRTQHDQLLNRGLEVWKPVIAAINGYCLGGGVTLMLATDIRVAAPDATFGLSEVKRGIIAANGGTQRILEQLPYPIAMEMLLTGEPISAAAAERWGLINKIVPRDQLMATALAYAQRIAANAPLAVQASKELALRSRDVDRATGLRMEQVISRLLRETADAKEGARAFAEKRPADFKGA